MKVILDTNVFVSGVYFKGAPYVILDAWRSGRLTLVISPAIMEEYRRVAHDLAVHFPGVNPAEALELVAIHAEAVDAPPLSQQVCSDPDDDKFLACAIAGRTMVITSGDKALLKTNGYAGIEVLSPREFVAKFLSCP